MLYWMSRDQRVRDNHGLLAAQALALELETHICVAFALQPSCGAASRRHFEFMLTGLAAVERDLRALGIPFALLHGDAAMTIAPHAAAIGAGAVVCDFAPLAPSRARRAALAEALPVALIEVDSRNIVPAWLAADKHVYAAHNLRRRHAEQLPAFLSEIPAPLAQSGASLGGPTDWERARSFVSAAEHGPPLAIPAGEAAASTALAEFIDERLVGYAEQRGRPDVDHQSRLSPYLHFGQLSAQRAVLGVRSSGAPSEDIESFVDEVVTWRELSDNFCLNVAGYASVDGFADWARRSLEAHREDAREVVYDLETFERADTHDALWNAAQLEMVRTGRMHNYMRMYWAKKILEWSESPEEAMRIAVLLNDRYEIDGRDPNGYAGIAWSIGGVHDRPWKERSVYGQIRYMNANGARRKFDVDAYIRRVAPELLGPSLF